MQRWLPQRALPRLAAIGLPAAALAVIPALACSPAADRAAKPPELASAGQSTCKVKASQDKPLIVEWPSSERGDLEALASRGLVVVHYSGCEMRVLPRCKAPGQYQYRPFTPKQDRISIRNDDELWAAIPMGAARFEGELRRAGQLNVDMTIVGKLAADIGELDPDGLTGECSGATHALTGLTLGAFEFFSGAESRASAGAGLLGVGAEGSSGASRNALTRDGVLSACATATLEDKSPPGNCGAILRVEVAPIARARNTAIETAVEAQPAPATQPPSEVPAAQPARTEPEPTAAAPQTPPATPSTASAFDAVRDPTSMSKPPRARGVLVNEIAGLEASSKSMADSAPDKVMVLSRIAFAYVELGLAAHRDATNATTAGDRGKAVNVELLARKNAIANFRTVIDRFPMYTRRDAVLYSLALEHERSGDLMNARKAQYQLIREVPSSRMIPLAYFAFGEMFAEDAKSDAAKWPLAEQSYREVVKYPAPANPVFDLGQRRLQTALAAQGKK